MAFDAFGRLIGSDGNSLLQATYAGDTSVFLPAVGTVQGMDWLPDGDLVFADGIGAVRRVSPAGAVSLVAAAGGGSPTYGVTVGPDGAVYSADWISVQRTDPATGARTAILNDPRVAPYVVDFSPDHHTMYVGTIWNGGTVWSVPLGDDLNPTGPATAFATVGGGDQQLHDGLAVDWCGNVWVVEFYTNNLYRIRPTGEVEVMVDFSSETYGHGLEWGSGIGGWRTDALYLPQPYHNNRVMEIVIGVPGREWTGLP